MKTPRNQEYTLCHKNSSTSRNLKDQNSQIETCSPVSGFHFLGVLGSLGSLRLGLSGSLGLTRR